VLGVAYDLMSSKFSIKSVSGGLIIGEFSSEFAGGSFNRFKASRRYLSLCSDSMIILSHLAIYSGIFTPPPRLDLSKLQLLELVLY